MEKPRQDFENLQVSGIKEEDFKKYDILILPENIIWHNEDDKFLETADSLEFYKILKGKGIKVANATDLHLESKLIERRGNDIWLGVIQFIQIGMISIFWGLLQNYLYDKIKIKDKSSTEQLKILADTDIHITIVTKKFKINYSGNAKTLKSIIKSLKS